MEDNPSGEENKKPIKVSGKEYVMPHNTQSCEAKKCGQGAGKFKLSKSVQIFIAYTQECYKRQIGGNRIENSLKPREDYSVNKRVMFVNMRKISMCI